MVLEKTLQSPLDCKEIKLAIPKEINPEYSVEGPLHQQSKYWSFSFSISPSSEYSELISFRIDWFDLLGVKGTLKSLLQYQFESINSSALSLLYGPTVTSIHDYWKNHSFDYVNLCWQSDVSAF